MINDINIPVKLKELRKLKGLSQKDLSDGVCTQAMISNFEKGESIPSSTTLYKISQKLGVDMNYFFNLKSGEIENENEEVKALIRKFTRQHDYKSIRYIVTNELMKEQFNSSEDKQFLLWHDGICDYYLNKDSEKALEKLFNALNLNTKNLNQELSIKNSIAIIYFETKQYEKSLDIYNECMENKNGINKLTEIRIIYGCSRTLTQLGSYEEAILHCKKAVNICISEESLYLLGELLFQIARNLIFLEKLNEAQLYLNQAQVIFEVQNNHSYINIVEKLRLEINN